MSETETTTTTKTKEPRKQREGGQRREALDVTTTDVADLVKPGEDAYFEDENHRPDPLYQYGTVDTTEGGGGVHGEIHNVTPAFAEARARNLVTAARALDPDDLEVPAELVTLPEGTVTVSGTAKTADDGREDIERALNALAEDPHVLGASSPAQRAAAEEWDDGLNDGDADNDGKPDALERDKGTGSESDPSRRTGEKAGASSTGTTTTETRTDRPAGQQAGAARGGRKT